MREHPFGALVRYMRILNGQLLSDMARGTGIPSTQILSMERGQLVPTHEERQAIARYLRLGKGWVAALHHLAQVPVIPGLVEQAQAVAGCPCPSCREVTQ